MKKSLLLNFGIVVFAVLLLANCESPSDPSGSAVPTVINIASISGITVPAPGGTPVTVITATAQYTGTVVWSPAHESFQASTAYFATITLTAKNGYALEGVTKDFFKVTGANKVNNDADSGVITAVFPRTAGTIDNPSVIDIQTIEGIAPISGGIPKESINPTAQYTGTITWSPADNPFKPSIIYTATITLTPKTGFTITTVPADFFTVIGAETTSNEATSNIITAVFLNNHIHQWGDWSVTTAATCSTEGVETRECIYPAHKETRQIPTTPHDWEFIQGIAPTCTFAGSGTRKCKVCGKTETSDIFPALGHNWGEWTVTTPITSITEITETRICSHDSTHKETRKGPLESLPANTAAAPYTIKLNVNDFGGDMTTPGSIGYILSHSNGRYFYLDLSDSTMTTIPDSAFYNGKSSPVKGCDTLVGITIPNSVTSIGGGAFSGCTSLTSVTIPDSVTSIGYYAFGGCTSLAAINVDYSNTEYSSADGVLYNNSKTTLIRYPIGKASSSFTIPDTVVVIGESAFSRCANLTSVIIPDSVTDIQSFAFSDCTNLFSVTIGSGVIDIRWGAFMGCTSLASVTIPASVTGIGIAAFGGCTGLASVTIPNSVTIIGSGAFSSCTSLTSVIIPNSVTGIGYDAFSRCTRLASITIPDSVKSIGYEAFSSTAWFNNQPDGVVYAGKVAYAYKGDMPANTSITIRDGTKGITGRAFSGRTGLASVTIPDSVTSIGNEAFWNCTSLASVTIGSGVIGIEYSAFSGCTSLASITIPNSVTDIGGRAFEGCTSLTSITFQGTIAHGFSDDSFYGDLREKFKGTPGTYTTTAPVGNDSVWTKQ